VRGRAAYIQDQRSGPVSSKDPGLDRLAVRVPETERRRLKLKGFGPCWVILDEGNTDYLRESFHIEPVTYDPPIMHYGKFSRAFMGQVLKVLSQAIREKKVALLNASDNEFSRGIKEMMIMGVPLSPASALLRWAIGRLTTPGTL
jgi:hypothetical protein